MKSRVFIVAVLTALAAAVAPLAASAQSWPWNYNGGSNVRQAGVIASVQGSSLTLQSGETVFLHQGTVINPTGTTLQPGMQIQILGGYAGNNAFNANEVDVVGYNSNQYPYGNNPYGYNNSQYQREQRRLARERARWQREQWQQQQQLQHEQWQRQQQWQHDQAQRRQQWQHDQAMRYGNGNSHENRHRDRGDGN